MPRFAVVVLGKIAGWRCKHPLVPKLTSLFTKQTNPHLMEVDVEADPKWAGQGPGPLQHAFSLQVINGESEVRLAHKLQGWLQLVPCPAPICKVRNVARLNGCSSCRSWHKQMQCDGIMRMFMEMMASLQWLLVSSTICLTKPPHKWPLRHPVELACPRLYPSRSRQCSQQPR